MATRKDDLRAMKESLSVEGQKIFMLLEKMIADRIGIQTLYSEEELAPFIRKEIREQLKDLRRTTEPKKKLLAPFDWDNPEEAISAAEDAIIKFYNHPRQRIEKNVFRVGCFKAFVSVGIDFSGKVGGSRRDRFVELLDTRGSGRIERREYSTSDRGRKYSYWVPTERPEWLKEIVAELERREDG